MNSIGIRLKEARIARGLTQEQLARGVATKGFVSLVERDLLNPSLPKLRLLADRLGRPLAYFVQDLPDQDAEYLRRTAELAIKAKEPNRANDSYRLGDTAGSIDYLHQALVVATDAESLLRLANAHMGLGIAARAAGNLDQAIAHCNRALNLHRRIGQPKIANQILHNL